MNKIIRACTVSKSLGFVMGMLLDLKKNYEVLLLSSPGERMDEITKDYGVRGIGIQMERRISPLNDIKALFKIVSLFHKEKPTMVHSMTPKAGLLCMMAAWLTRVPVRVHTFTGLVFPTSKGIKRRILMFTDWLTCACATHVIPEGEGVKNDLWNNHITRKPLRVLGYGNVMGVDMERFSRRKEVMDVVTQKALKSQDLFTFLFVGRIVRDKGINELCDAFTQLHQQYPNTRLWLVGSFEDSLDPISEDARKAIDTNDAICAVGRKGGDDLLAYYAAADCFVFPSYREGFPNTVLEAGAMGLPNIVTDINGSREIIKDGINGVIVPSKDADALYHAMQQMVTDEGYRKMIASNARRMIASRFEQGFVRKCLYDFYDEILNTPKLKRVCEQFDELQNVNTEL
jgi:glycosyltransferase involved in cell wall biosynthesis